MVGSSGGKVHRWTSDPSGIAAAADHDDQRRTRGTRRENRFSSASSAVSALNVAQCGGVDYSDTLLATLLSTVEWGSCRHPAHQPAEPTVRFMETGRMSEHQLAFARSAAGIDGLAAGSTERRRSGGNGPRSVIRSMPATR